MNFSLKDVGALGRPLMVVAVIVAASAGGIYYTKGLVKQARTSLTAAQGQLDEARKRVQQSGEERDMITRYVGPYTALVERGIVGEEQRLNWVDALRAANSQTKLYGVEYEVGTQQPYAFATEVQAAGIPVQQSLMKLRFGVLYETDLLAFFRSLQTQNVGVFSVNQCVLQRMTRDPTPPANAPTLRAECEVSWITIGAQTPEGSS
jgi:hypothetical protein